jgi:HPt (histidine-containing phosphotransfer) domain-containing protein
VIRGIQQQCQEAGMDDYISKPFTIDDIKKGLGNWLKPEFSSGKTDEQEKIVENNAEVADIPKSDEDGSGPSPIDRTPLLALQELQIDGEQNIVNQVINTYLTESDSLIDRLQKASSDNDISVLQKTAHSLKSSSAQVGAFALSGMCKKLEMACKSNTFDSDFDSATRIKEEYIRVKRALQQEISIHEL